MVALSADYQSRPSTEVAGSPVQGAGFDNLVAQASAGAVLQPGTYSLDGPPTTEVRMALDKTLADAVARGDLIIKRTTDRSTGRTLNAQYIDRDTGNVVAQYRVTGRGPDNFLGPTYTAALDIYRPIDLGPAIQALRGGGPVASPAEAQTPDPVQTATVNGHAALGRMTQGYTDTARSAFYQAASDAFHASNADKSDPAAFARYVANLESSPQTRQQVQQRAEDYLVALALDKKGVDPASEAAGPYLDAIQAELGRVSGGSAGRLNWLANLPSSGQTLARVAQGAQGSQVAQGGGQAGNQAGSEGQASAPQDGGGVSTGNPFGAGELVSDWSGQPAIDQEAIRNAIPVDPVQTETRYEGRLFSDPQVEQLNQQQARPFYDRGGLGAEANRTIDGLQAATQEVFDVRQGKPWVALANGADTYRMFNEIGSDYVKLDQAQKAFDLAGQYYAGKISADEIRALQGSTPYLSEALTNPEGLRQDVAGWTTNLAGNVIQLSQETQQNDVLIKAFMREGLISAATGTGYGLFRNFLARMAGGFGAGFAASVAIPDPGATGSDSPPGTDNPPGRQSTTNPFNTGQNILGNVIQNVAEDTFRGRLPSSLAIPLSIATGSGVDAAFTGANTFARSGDLSQAANDALGQFATSATFQGLTQGLQIDPFAMRTGTGRVFGDGIPADRSMPFRAETVATADEFLRSRYGVSVGEPDPAVRGDLSRPMSDAELRLTVETIEPVLADLNARFPGITQGVNLVPYASKNSEQVMGMHNTGTNDLVINPNLLLGLRDPSTALNQTLLHELGHHLASNQGALTFFTELMNRRGVSDSFTVPYLEPRGPLEITDYFVQRNRESIVQASGLTNATDEELGRWLLQNDAVQTVSSVTSGEVTYQLNLPNDRGRLDEEIRRVTGEYSTTNRDEQFAEFMRLYLSQKVGQPTINEKGKPVVIPPELMAIGDEVMRRLGYNP